MGSIMGGGSSGSLTSEQVFPERFTLCLRALLAQVPGFAAL